ncbi:MAG: PAS domain-containing sensor histidine kinase [Bdellovibrionaceae bacterium]|nr:PAS domain-containing sensor histidine kinase [Pseudobdellovibrionaceae bacterium]
MKSGFFPWRIFWKFYLTLIVLLNLSFVAALFAATVLGDFSLADPRLPAIFGLFLIVTLGISALAAYRVAAPLKRVILKALRLAHKKRDLNIDESAKDEDLFEYQPGEYYELEQALDQIRRKMKKRRIQLAHEREESQALMSFLADAVVSVDCDERVKFFNSSFAKHFLSSEQIKTSNEGGPGLKLIDIFRDDEVLFKIRQVKKDGLVQTLQKRLSTKIDPTGRYFSIIITPLREEKTREIYASLVLFHDITEYHLAEQIRVEFVENASHELRTPLTSIKGFVTTALDDAQAGRFDLMSSFLKTISKNVDRLSELVNDLLTISSLESSGVLNLENIEPQEITEEVMERLSPLASNKDIMMKATYNRGAFRGDYRLLDQVLTNLVGNAIKYIPTGGRIEILWSTDPGTDIVRLTVKDNGPGIAEEHLHRLFERFYRVDKARSRDVGGTGLGLAIVKHVVQSHGGQISVRSELGRGSEFIAHFPDRL